MVLKEEYFVIFLLVIVMVFKVLILIWDKGMCLVVYLGLSVGVLCVIIFGSLLSLKYLEWGNFGVGGF